MSLGRSGPGGFLETHRSPFGGVFLASAQTASEFLGTLPRFELLAVTGSPEQAA